MPYNECMLYELHLSKAGVCVSVSPSHPNGFKAHWLEISARKIVESLDPSINIVKLGLPAAGNPGQLAPAVLGAAQRQGGSCRRTEEWGSTLQLQRLKAT